MTAMQVRLTLNDAGIIINALSSLQQELITEDARLEAERLEARFRHLIARARQRAARPPAE